ncbi:MAG: septum site-determining protein MinC [Pseudomonadota bacterium]
MHSTTDPTIKTSPGFQFKGGLFTLTTLQLLHTDLSELGRHLDEKIRQAPNFFTHSPVVLDIHRLMGAPIDFEQLIKDLRARRLIPFGVRGATPEQQVQAIACGLGVLPESKVRPSSMQQEQDNRPVRTETELSGHEENMTPTKIVTQPVRSGQQIYVRGGDLIVLSAVSAGAEILADGHIHIYGPLRGRAIAGVSGDTKARIFCHSLEAELVSVAGHYKVSEDLKECHWKESVSIQLVGDRLQIEPLYDKK